MQNPAEDKYVADTLKKLYSKNLDLDEFKIGKHKEGGCEICYEGGINAIKQLKGGVRVYKKENPNDKMLEGIHIDINSHNYKKKNEKESDKESESDKEEVKRVVGGRRLVDKSQLPGSSMSGMGKKKLNPKMERRMKKVKEIMKEKSMSMIEASKYIKDKKIDY
jgi:hypothetical protein